MQLKKFYKNKRVFVTGITGFKGAWLASWLIKLGANVYGIGSKPNKNQNLFYSMKLDKKVNLNLFDIRDYKKLRKYVKKIKPQIVFHLAAQPLIYLGYKEPHTTLDVNFKGTLNVLEACRTTKYTKSIIIVTSDKCYESNNSTRGFVESDRLGGIDPYSASKASAEIMTRAYRKSFFSKKNIGVSSARAGNVIGGGDWSGNRLIPDCIRSLLSRKKIIIRNPYFNRPWQHVLEPLKGYLILAKKQFESPNKFSGSYNFGTKKNSLTDVKTIVEYLINFWGEGKMKIKKSKFYEQTNLQLSINKSKEKLQWLPTYSIKNNVKFTVEWYKKVKKLKQNPFKTTLDQIDKYMHDSKIN